MKYQLISQPDPQLTPIEQVLVNRGIRQVDVPFYLSPTAEAELPPELLKNMEAGAKMLMRHLGTEKQILVIVDDDVDGQTSAALFLNYLHSFIPTVVENQFIYRFHTGKKHGIAGIDIPENVGLIVCPDSSSEEVALHRQCLESGIEVLVLDHHNSNLGESPYACVINNQLCGYPNKSLSGVGIVYKFCQYLDKYLKLDSAEERIDLVSTGIVADCMDLRDMETRYYVYKGCEATRNPFIKAMVDKAEFKMKGEVSPFGISFYIAPFINAVCRIGSPQEKQLIFEAMLEWKAYEKIPSTKRGCKGQMEMRLVQAVRTSGNIKNRQDKMKEEGVQRIQELIESEGLLNNKILIIKADGLGLERGVSGLIANQLMGAHQRSTLVLFSSVSESGEKIWSGSARGYAKSEMKDFRGFILESGLAEFASGHANSFGTSFTDANLDAFIAYSNAALADIDFSPSYQVDYVLPQSFDSQLVLDIGNFKSLWGQQVEEPLIVVENLRITADRITLRGAKQDTLIISLPNGVECIKFRTGEEEYNKLYSETGCTVINLIATCSINNWNGLNKPQLEIKDYEIISTQQFYF